MLGRVSCFLILLSVLPLARVRSQVPAILNYQGRVVVGVSGFDGTGQFKFALVNGDGSQTFWRSSPDADANGEPDAGINVPVSRGLYSVLLGDSSIPNMAAIPPEVFGNAQVHLRVWFNDGASGFQRLSPDPRIASVGYALMAAGVPDGSISANKLGADALALIQAPPPLGTLTPAHIPGLDASKVISGQFDPARVPANPVLDAALAAVAVQVAALSNQVRSLESQLSAPPVPGLVSASTDPQDPALLGLGRVRFASVAASGWAEGSAVGALGGRHAHTAVWTGDQWLIWGGTLASGLYSSTGAYYSPTTDSWTGLNPAEAPAARGDHGAVWDGSRLVIWGGFSRDGYLNTGAIYSVASQQWTATAALGAPSARSRFVTGWSGSRMLIFGGRNATGPLGGGTSFDPVSNTWTPIPGAGEPAPSFDGAAAMTPGGWVVWGGQGASALLNSGAVLGLNNGTPTTWRPISLVNAPAARSRHSLVSIGSRVIVWGGVSGGNPKADGAIYDPGTDTWTPMTSTGAPAGRSGHSAVWNGEELLVWGGETSVGPTATGGAYNPTLDRWRPLSTAGSPLARTGATSAWTGTELLVFGGIADGVPAARMQRLNPQPTWHLFRKP